MFCLPSHIFFSLLMKISRSFNTFSISPSFIFHSDTLYEGGFFKGNNQHTICLLFLSTCTDTELYLPFLLSLSIAHLYFPKEYPLRPPRMRFVTEIWHPNIDQNGDGKYILAMTSMDDLMSGPT